MLGLGYRASAQMINWIIAYTARSALSAGFRFRRISPIAVRSGESLLTEPTAATQIREREPLFAP